MSETSPHKRAWPLVLAAREGVATARTGRWTSLLIAVAVAWIIAAPGAADSVSVTRLVESERAWVDAGGYVLVVTGVRQGDTSGPIPAGVCDRLSRIDGIEASFALTRTNASGTFAHIPGGRAYMFDVSAGVGPFLGVQPDSRGIVIASTGLAQRTGILDGDAVAVARHLSLNVDPGTSDILTARIADTSVMGEEFDGAMLVPAQLTDTADACYVRTDAAHHSAVLAALPAYLAYGGKPAVPNSRLFSDKFTVDYSNAYQDRPLRWLWIPSAALLGVLWAMLQWFRRSHIAIYATFGMRAHSRLAMQLSEWAVLAGLGALWGWSMGVVGALAFGARTAQALTLVTYHGLLTLLGATAFVLLLGLRDTGTLLNALKDR